MYKRSSGTSSAQLIKTGSLGLRDTRPPSNGKIPVFRREKLVMKLFRAKSQNQKLVWVNNHVINSLSVLSRRILIQLYLDLTLFSIWRLCLDKDREIMPKGLFVWLGGVMIPFLLILYFFIELFFFMLSFFGNTNMCLNNKFRAVRIYRCLTVQRYYGYELGIRFGWTTSC